MPHVGCKRHKQFCMCKCGVVRTFGEGGGRDVVLVPVAVASSHRVKLLSQQAGEGRAEQGAGLRLLQETSGQQVHLTCVPVTMSTLQY